MNVLKHKVAETKAERERVKQRRANVNETVEFFKYASEDEWILDSYPEAVVTVTHWMPLPKPPKEVE